MSGNSNPPSSAPQSQEDELDRIFIDCLQPKYGLTPPASILGWEEVHWPTQKAKLLRYLTNHDAQKKAELLAGLPEKRLIHYVEGYRGNRLNEAKLEGFNEALTEVRAAIEAVYRS
jgi:hypothetical protein